MEEVLGGQITVDCDVNKHYVIVGRPNVGKSSIFNFFVEKHEAFVQDEDGTTKDWRSKKVGNIIIWDTPGVFKIEEMPPCEVSRIFFVTEHNVLNSDKMLFIQLKKKYKDVVVIINKIDKGEDDYSFFTGEVIKISMKSRYGLALLKSSFLEYYIDVTQKEKKIWALLGKPNVGKSSIVNALANKEIHRVEACAGTTKEFLPVELDEKILLDTPGQRHRAIFPRYSEIFGIVFIIDLKQERQDLRMIGMIQDRRKPLIVVINKTDLAKKDEIEVVSQNIKRFWDIPIIKTSCLKKIGISQILEQIKNIEESYYKRIKTSALNAWLNEEISRVEPKIKFITQIEVAPPKFFVDVQLPEHKERMLKRRLVKRFGFEGVPMLFRYKQPS